MHPATILVADDDAVARALLAEALKKEGYAVEAFASGEETIARGCQGHVDVVLTDIRMGAVDGLTVLRKFKQMSPNTVVVVLTAFGSLEGAVEAIKQGAYDYLAKPFRKDEIKLVVKRSLDHCRLLRENAQFRHALQRTSDCSPLVGSSPAMLEVYKLVARVAESKSTVLLQGESGTGKELIARAIHANGLRRAKPFVPVNCGALPDSLLESEMFGYEKGAFTGAVRTKAGLFEAANGGSLFLDEIGELGAAVQVKLLRVMQDQEVRRVGGTGSIKVDVRIIAATNRDLKRLVTEGKFRNDLFYRLQVVPITLPSLVERREDIPMLVHHFLQKCARGEGPTVRGVLPETMGVLTRYRWPGNVRELENAIEQAVSLSPGPLLTPDDLPEAIRHAAVEDREGIRRSDPASDATLTLEEVEKRHLVLVLKETKGNKVKAAKILGIDRRTLYRMAERLGLNLEDAIEGVKND
ncbi:MAG: sigma-54-dependent Fis family transcriptional regulator [Nitrospira sp.]|nr:sigma-54-dependent Fis family transcriptional regulator [Nitrospira sp.]